MEHGKVIELNRIARPINFNNRQEKLEKRRKEILVRYEELRKNTNELLRKNRLIAEEIKNEGTE